VSAPALTYRDFLELRRWIQSLTAATDWAWTLAEGKEPDAPFRVVPDVLDALRKGRGLQGKTILRIPRTETVDGAKRLVIERLAQGSDPCPSS